ncbi:MAG: chloride channel protein [Promethearchaeota archaeon]
MINNKIIAAKRRKNLFKTTQILAPITNPKKWLLLNIFGVIIGIFGGFLTILFRLIISYLENISQNLLNSNFFPSIKGYNIGYIIFGAIAGIICSIIGNKFAEESKGTGIPEIIKDTSLKGGNVRRRVGIAKIVGASLNITVSSAGREGPVALIGGWAGSLVGQVFKFKPYEKRILISTGISATVAGIFNAPLGASLFAMEVLFNGLGIFSIVPNFISAVISTLIVSQFFGAEPLFSHTFNYEILHFGEIPLIIGLSMLFAVLGFLWLKIFKYIRKMFLNKKINKYIRPILGGALSGLIIGFFPKYGIIGSGFDTINSVINETYFPFFNETYFPFFLLLLGMVKMFATAINIGSDNSGGIFGPSLYIGCMFGGFFGYLLKSFFPNMISEPAIYMYVGMAAMFSAAAHTPLNVPVMIGEISKNFFFIPILMISSASSFFVAWLTFKRTSIYTLKLEMRGLPLKVGSLFLLQNISLSEIPLARVKKIYVDKFDKKLIEILPLIDDLNNYDQEFAIIVDSKENIALLQINKMKNSINNQDKTIQHEMLSHFIEFDFPCIEINSKLQNALDILENFKQNYIIIYQNIGGKISYYITNKKSILNIIFEGKDN